MHSRAEVERMRIFLVARLAKMAAFARVSRAPCPVEPTGNFVGLVVLLSGGTVGFVATHCQFLSVMSTRVVHAQVPLLLPSLPVMDCGRVPFSGDF